MKSSAKFTLSFTFLLIISLLNIGCAKLKHMRELLTLKALSEEGDSINEYVTLKNDRFHMLYSIAESGDLVGEYPDMESIRMSFGEPIRIVTPADSSGLTEWIYREQTNYFSSPKVWLYFDNQEKLVEWQIHGGDHAQIESQTPQTR